MSLVVNGRWTAKLAEQEQRPVYVLKLNGLGEIYTNVGSVPACGPWSGDWLNGIGEMEDIVADWSLVTTGSATIVQDGSQQRSGDGCAKMTRTGTDTCLLQIANEPGLIPDKWYRLQLAVKGDAAYTNPLRFAMRNQTTGNWLRADGSWGAYQVIDLSDAGTEYRDVSYDFQFNEAGAASTDNNLLYLYNLGSAGTVLYIDDFYWYGPMDSQYGKPYLETPAGGRSKVDPIDGKQSVGAVAFELVDHQDEITALISTDSSGAALDTLINRQASLWIGWRDIPVSDYVSRYVGRIGGDIQMGKGLDSYRFSIQSYDHQLDGKIMSAATKVSPITVIGNVVNLYYALLADDFTTGGDFPLTSFTAGATGIGIDAASLNTTQMIEQRDTWHSASSVEVTFEEEEEARGFLQDEIFRSFQCFPAISGLGLIGLRFHVPALPAASAPTLTADDVISIGGWRRKHSDHLNKFTVLGDFSTGDDEFQTTLYGTETAEDLADQTSTGETIEYLLESKLMTTALGGVSIAAEMTGRHRVRYIKGPGELDLNVLITRQDLEQGDVIAVTDDRIPDLLTGTRGVTSRLMQILSVDTKWDKGEIRLTLLDTGYKRYGVIAPNGTADYKDATAQERNTFFYIGDASGNVSESGGVGTVEGYRFI